MSGTATVTTRASIAHLYRRAGFGASSAELDRATGAGYSATVDELLAGLDGPDEPAPAPPRLSSYLDIARGRGGDLWEQENALIGWWLEKMATGAPLREKLTLLLHGQFPTGYSKVGAPDPHVRAERDLPHARRRHLRRADPGARQGAGDARSGSTPAPTSASRRTRTSPVS